VRGDLGTVAELLRGADDRRDGEYDAGHVLEEFLHLPAFPRELLGVGEVLVLAAAAAAEERTARRDAMRGRREHLDEIRLGEVLVVAEDADLHALAGQGKRHHDDPRRGGGIFDFGEGDAAEADAQVGERGDLELQLVMIRKGPVVEFALNHGIHRTHGRGRQKEIAEVCFPVFRVFRGNSA
jgi:hypothetical protein